MNHHQTEIGIYWSLICVTMKITPKINKKSINTYVHTSSEQAKHVDTFFGEEIASFFWLFNAVASVDLTFIIEMNTFKRMTFRPFSMAHRHSIQCLFIIRFILVLSGVVGDYDGKQ